jgi:DnaJ-domain-containing protein 1
MPELAELILKKNQILAQLNRISKFVASFPPGDNVNKIKSRMSALDDLDKEFRAVQYQIELIDNTASETNDRETFEDSYFDTKSMMQSVIDSHVQDTSQEVNVNLPQLNLPQFSGSYSEWTSFHDTFNSLIHENKGLNDIRRFHYLKGVLKGEALKCIESLKISGANYAIAWDILKKRYKNTRLIVQEHVQAILNAPPLNKTIYSGLRQLLDTVISNLEAFKVLNINTISWDPLIVPIITQKLDFSTKREWVAKLNSENPKLADLQEFLNDKCNLLESLNSGNQKSQSAQHKTHAIANHASANDKLTCSFCQKGHFIFQCADFLKLAVTERFNQVKRLNLCVNCLKHNHSALNCKSGSCRECNKKHNRLLHLNKPNQTIIETPQTIETIQQPSSTSKTFMANIEF